MTRPRPKDLALVSFDLDGTLVHPAIFNVVADALGFGAPLLESYRRYVAGEMTLEEAFHHDFAYFVGREVAPMREALAKSDAWTPGIVGAVERLHEAGLGVIVTTDQPRFLAEHTLDFGVDHVVCTDAAVRHGRVTADAHPAFDKWANLARYLAAKRIDPARVVHVGNGTNDIPVFERVGWAVAVSWLAPVVRERADAGIEKPLDLGEVADLVLG
ncbi:MAG TPA: haloacid dehalogenase-like hydrolase [Candidatus Thermoplasmatota archaeon]|nr:haloacid dehalogenase-like hydrolase [Candidatus Thermoplasmatota archaeon]